MAGSEEEEALYPCPADGSKLYGWTAAHDPLDRDKRIVLDRCESCGLAVTRAATPPDVDAELEPLISAGPDGMLELTAPNRRSFGGGIGGAQWAGLEPELHRLHLNPESVRLLLAQRGLQVSEVRTPFAAEGRRLMVQTFLNAFTFRDNFLRNAGRGRIEPATSGERWLYRLDWLVSVLVYVPATFLAFPIEALGAAFGRGGVMEVKTLNTRLLDK
ncbi:MAG: hypothetical protein M3Q53_01230 [Actinomycetota bacterium]|nr:hypothetical protein [Actinomycetota bacterium]